MVCHYVPKSKLQSKQCKYTESPVKKKFRAQQTVNKAKLTVFGGMRGLITIDFFEKVQL